MILDQLQPPLISGKFNDYKNTSWTLITMIIWPFLILLCLQKSNYFYKFNVERSQEIKRNNKLAKQEITFSCHFTIKFWKQYLKFTFKHSEGYNGHHRILEDSYIVFRLNWLTLYLIIYKMSYTTFATEHVDLELNGHFLNDFFLKAGFHMERCWSILFWSILRIINRLLEILGIARKYIIDEVGPTMRQHKY